MNKLADKKVGLALGAGSARGWAHIGVIHALADLGIRVDYIAGTSMGSLVGAFMAAGKIDALRSIALELDWKHIIFFFDVVFPKSGLIDGRKITELIGSHVGDIHMDQLNIPFRSVATDLVTSNEVVLHSGDLIEAVRASISLPGIFTPVEKDAMVLADGGMVNPLPVSVVRDMGADFVIAVDLNHNIQEKKRTIRSNSGVHNNRDEKSRLWKLLEQQIKKLDIPLMDQLDRWTSHEDTLPNIFEILTSSINIMETQITKVRLEVEPADVLIRPSLGNIRLLNFHQAEEAIGVGYQSAMEALKER